MELQKPSNHRTKWTITEVDILLEEVKSGLSFEIIANNHYRTVGAIKYKLYRYIIQLLKKNPKISIKELTKITSLNKEEILYGLDKLNYNYPLSFLLDSNDSNDSNNKPKIILKIILFQITVYGVLFLYKKYFMQV